MSLPHQWLFCPVNLCSAPFVCTAEMLMHLRNQHNLLDYQNGLRCQYANCKRIFKSYESFRVHHSRYHLSSNTGTSGINTFLLNDSSFNQESNCLSDKCETNFPNFLEEFSLFYLKAREYYVLPVHTVKDIFDDFVRLLSIFKSTCEKAAGKCFQAFEIPDFQAMWNDLRKEAFFKNYCKSIGLVEPLTIDILEEETNKVFSFQYVPILNTLKNYLSHGDVLDSISREKMSSEDVFDELGNRILKSLADGDYFANNAFFRKNLNLLRLYLYCDELEICNPLGSARAVHKLTCLYFSVGNIEVKFLSNLKNIHLLAVIPSSLVKKFGYSKLLKRLEQDLVILENEGISFSVEGINYEFKGGIGCLIGDNLGSNDIGGFRKCFSSGRICRFCLCLYDDIFIKFHPAYFTMRSPEIHQLHINAVKNDSTLVSAYGVRCEPPFEKLNSFNAITSLPPDCQHDFLEGIIPFFLDCMLQKLCSDKVLVKSDLISRFQNFEFGFNDRSNAPKHWVPFGNKPLSSSNAWCLFCCLPFMIGDMVPENEPSWELYLILCTICEIVFAPSVNCGWICYLQDKIQSFLEKFNEQFPRKMKPKMHFMLHYPELLLKFGPLKNLWCMRFESFHQKIKKVVKRCGSFKNVPVTVADRLQKFKCWELSGFSCLNTPDSHSQPHNISLSNVPSYIYQHFHSFNSVSLDDKVNLFTFLKYDEISYHVNDLCVVDISDENIIEFMQIHAIVEQQNTWYLAGKILLTESFDHHYHSYKLKDYNLWHVIKAGSELSTQSLDMYKINEKCYVRLKNLVCFKNV